MGVKPQLLPAIVAAILLAGCATPETRLRDGLVNAGLSPPLAGCMAHRMAGRLSLGQLMRLRDLPQARESVTIGDFLHSVRALRDPGILSITSSSAALCATGLAR
jgi:hypothetical protein